VLLPHARRITQVDADQQSRMAFVFRENLIGQELVGRVYFDTTGRR